jgi:hypothetical protein
LTIEQIMNCLSMMSCTIYHFSFSHIN